MRLLPIMKCDQCRYLHMAYYKKDTVELRFDICWKTFKVINALTSPNNQSEIPDWCPLKEEDDEETDK